MERCPRCKALIVLVGYRHRCIEREAPPSPPKKALPPKKKPKGKKP